MIKRKIGGADEKLKRFVKIMGARGFDTNIIKDDIKQTVENNDNSGSESPIGWGSQGGYIISKKIVWDGQYVIARYVDTDSGSTEQYHWHL